MIIVKRVRNIPSNRKLYRRLWSDPELRELCDIKEYEKPYYTSLLTRFSKRIGPERLERIMDSVVDRLKGSGIAKGEIVGCLLNSCLMHPS